MADGAVSMVDVGLIDYESGEVTAADIVLLGGVIEDVSVRVSTGDHPGPFLVPGLVDLHAHLFEDELGAGTRVLGAKDPSRWTRAQEHLLALANNGITAVREVGAPNRENLKLNALSDSIGGPHVFPCGSLITAIGGHASALGREIGSSARAMRQAVREEAEYGAKVLKLINFPVRFTTSAIRAGVEEAHRQGIHVAYHAGDPESVEIGIAAGVDSIEHGLPEKLEPSLPAFVPTLACAETMQTTGNLLVGEEGQPVFDEWRTFLQRRAAIVSEDELRVFAGTDAFLPPLDAYALHEELKTLERYGRSRSRVLSDATLGAMRLMGSRTTGLIRKGWVADVLLVDRNPLEELDTLRTPVAVFIGGNRVGSA